MSGAEGTRRRALYDWPFLSVCAVTFLGFGSNSIVTTILPLLILERGGDATLIGLVIAAYSVPSVVLRPIFGRLVDEWSRFRTSLLGTAGLGVVAFLYLVPSLLIILVARVIHGTAWGAFNTGTSTTIAAVVPEQRRSEGTAFFNLMPQLAQVAFPSVALVLLAVGGLETPFIAAGVLGLAAASVLFVPPRPSEATRNPPSARRHWWSGLVEKRALLPLAFQSMFAATATLYWVYPPVFVALHDLPTSQLALYYPVVGAALIVTRLYAGRFADRISRGFAIMAGASVVAVGLIVASFADSVALLTVAGMLNAAGSAGTDPTAMALAIDRSQPGRRGAALATWSLGYQVGMGTGAVIWGAVIDTLGFPAPYLMALIVQAAVIGLVFARRSDLGLGFSRRSA